MENYKGYIENLAENKEGMLFENSSAEHASIVMSTIFKHSNNDVKIFAGSLCGEVSNGTNESLKREYLNQLIKFIERKGNLSIVLDELKDEFKQTDLFKNLKTYSLMYPNRISIKYMDPEKKDPNSKLNNHFTIGDSRMFRFERDIENYTAVGSFNNEEVCSALEKSFKMLSNLSKDVELN